MARKEARPIRTGTTKIPVKSGPEGPNKSGLGVAHLVVLSNGINIAEERDRFRRNSDPVEGRKRSAKKRGPPCNLTMACAGQEIFEKIRQLQDTVRELEYTAENSWEVAQTEIGSQRLRSITRRIVIAARALDQSVLEDTF